MQPEKNALCSVAGWQKGVRVKVPKVFNIFWHYSPESIFSISMKKLKWKILTICKGYCFFCYLQMWLLFCHMRGQTNLHKRVLIEFALSICQKFSKPNNKTISHLQMDNFYHFNFCHNRRNGLSTSTNINDKFVAS